MSIRLIKDVYVADTARIVGEVTIGRGVSIWYGVSIRGDVAPVTIGDETNVQDNAVIHCDTDHPNVIGRRVTIGHGAIVHGCTIEDRVLVGMGAILLNGVVVGTGSIVAAGSLLPEGLVVPTRSLVMGHPAKVRRTLTDEEVASIQGYADNYVRYRLDYMSADDAG